MNGQSLLSLPAVLLSQILHHLADTVLATMLRLDDRRIQWHLARAERRLRSADIGHLSDPVLKRRLEYLDRLHEYRLAARFPRHSGPPLLARGWRSPRFIDDRGRLCAVADLLVHSGQADLATHIAAADNLAFVRQMAFPELGAWADQSGLTVNELALIQPGYIWKEAALILGLISLVAPVLFIFFGHNDWSRPLMVAFLAYDVLFWGLVGSSILTATVLIPRRRARALKKIEQYRQHGDAAALANLDCTTWDYPTRSAARRALKDMGADRGALYSDILQRSPDRNARIIATGQLKDLGDPSLLPVVRRAMQQESDRNVLVQLKEAERVLVGAQSGGQIK